jgi:DNA polymerase III subunit delta'
MAAALTVRAPAPVFADLIGQEPVVAALAKAAGAAEATLRGAATAGMSHAWLFTGPPGSGRSTVARAFAAALQCPEQGCGVCSACHTVLADTHADVEVVRPSGLSYGVGDTRQLVRRAALSPAGGRWQVIVIEDADRLTEDAANALLKAIEEPPPRTVWLLCAPSADDLVPTIRSRCRLMTLRTPPVAAVAEVLVRRDGVDPTMAAFAASAAQGHIGRARRLATDAGARERRSQVLQIPLHVGDVGACLKAAAALVEAAEEEARDSTAEIDAGETDELRKALGEGTVGKGVKGLARGADGALKDLERRQKTRAKRLQRDAMDRALVDLASFYRDVLAAQVRSGVPLINDELRPAVIQVAERSTPERSLRRIEAILACREAIDANVAPLLAVEAMTLALRAD